MCHFHLSFASVMSNRRSCLSHAYVFHLCHFFVSFASVISYLSSIAVTSICSWSLSVLSVISYLSSISVVHIWVVGSGWGGFKLKSNNPSPEGWGTTKKQSRSWRNTQPTYVQVKMRTSDIDDYIIQMCSNTILTEYAYASAHSIAQDVVHGCRHGTSTLIDTFRVVSSSSNALHTC